MPFDNLDDLEPYEECEAKYAARWNEIIWAVSAMLVISVAMGVAAALAYEVYLALITCIEHLRTL